MLKWKKIFSRLHTSWHHGYPGTSWTATVFPFPLLPWTGDQAAFFSWTESTQSDDVVHKHLLLGIIFPLKSLDFLRLLGRFELELTNDDTNYKIKSHRNGSPRNGWWFESFVGFMWWRSWLRTNHVGYQQSWWTTCKLATYSQLCFEVSSSVTCNKHLFWHFCFDLWQVNQRCPWLILP